MFMKKEHYVILVIFLFKSSIVGFNTAEINGANSNKNIENLKTNFLIAQNNASMCNSLMDTVMVYLFRG